MAIKELVQLYESIPSDGSSTTLPPPSPARFITPTIRHSLLGDVARNEDEKSHPLSIDRTRNDARESTVDIADMNDISSLRTIPTEEYGMDQQSLDEDEDKESLLRPTYPPEPTPISPLSHKSLKNNLKLRKRRLFGSHSPVAAPVVFARDAAPLYLPRLDEHLGTLPKSHLHDLDGREVSGMFPPMDKLATSGLTLDDLEANCTPAPAWRNRKIILSTTVNVLLGILVSSSV